MKQYQSKWALFKGLCDRELPPVNATEPSVPVLARFLNHFSHEKGWKVVTVQNYETTVTFHWRKLKGFKLDPEESLPLGVWKRNVRSLGPRSGPGIPKVGKLC